ncbi:MAG: response regulator transcription factor [Clostridia bacterium]|nr:response regulator transcription factor [Clostridia bacterium]
MKIAICDDNKVILDGLTAGIRDLDPEKNEIQCFSSGDMLLRAYKAGKVGFDVIFLDIEMEGMDGIETANAIRSLDRHVLIVFVTSHERHARRCFECRPFRFLLKPVSEADLQKVYGEISRCLAEERKTFVFTENKQHIRLFCEDILFFESRGHWIVLHKKDGQTHKIQKNMKELMESVDKSHFCRVHRAFVVNLNAVYTVGNTELSLHQSEKTIPLGRTYKKEFMDFFTAFKERKYLL